jgi:DNA-binding NarL/FixJ family response regulator
MYVDSAALSTYIDGVTEATKLAGAASSTDPTVGLRAVHALRGLLETLEELQVRNARASGWSWQQIAESLGVSRQAVHKKYGRRRR